jgi:hypothetical protein
MTGTERVEVRRWSPAGVAYRTLNASAVPAEVAALASHPATASVEIRAEGATEWRKVA